MSQGFSTNLRGRVIAAMLAGLSTRKAAVAGLAPRRRVNGCDDSGTTAARQQAQPEGSKLAEHEARMLGLIEDC